MSTLDGGRIELRTLRAVLIPRRLLALAAALSLATTGCAGQVTAPLTDDAHLAEAFVAAPSPSPSAPTEELDRAGIQTTLDAVAAAFAARDPAALREWLHDPDSPFGEAWQERARNLEEVPLASYDLRLDDSLPDLATDAVRARHDRPVVVVYVVEEHAIEGFDERGPAAEDLFLTLVEHDGRWKVAGDRDAEALGLVSVDHLWDHGPVVATGRGSFLALHHPETAEVIPTLLDEAHAALDVMDEHWRLAWDRKVPLIVPRDEAELGELLHVTFDLTNFIAFATSTPTGELGAYELTGARIVLNTQRFLEKTAETRRRILAHELLHVASRPTSGPFVPSWVEEGLAQRLGEQASTTGTDLLQAVVARGFDGEPPADADFTTGGRDRIFLSYQLAWSFADHLADAYGEEQLARFYEALGRGAVRNPGDEDWHLDRAAREVYGRPLAELQEEWARSLRSP